MRDSLSVTLGPEVSIEPSDIGGGSPDGFR